MEVALPEVEGNEFHSGLVRGKKKIGEKYDEENKWLMCQVRMWVEKAKLQSLLLVVYPQYSNNLYIFDHVARLPLLPIKRQVSFTGHLPQVIV